MFAWLGGLVSRQWIATILMWLALVLCLRSLAPPWDDVTQDGDLAFLPAEMPSVVGERLRTDAFPAQRAQSQVVIVFARAGEPLTSEDLQAADRFAARFHVHLACNLMSRAAELPAEESTGASELLDEAAVHLTEASRLGEADATFFHIRAMSLERLGKADEAQTERQKARQLEPGLVEVVLKDWQVPLVDVWTRHHEVFGPKLRSEDKRAQLIVLQLDREFLATENIRVMEFMGQEVARWRRQLTQEGVSGLEVGVSGSAAIGGDMLRAAADSIRNTERFTILLVVVILLVVYRAPLMAIVPLITIGVSLATATSLLALLARWAQAPGLEWFDFQIFKTTKIFIVVILFGAGTDFCLFLIARYRECIEEGLDHAKAPAGALAGVGKALTGSALTTVFGLAMMFFADYGKFRNSGPAIGLCVLIALLASLTLSPALLRAFGPAIFWPSNVLPTNRNVAGRGRRFQAVWDRVADAIVRWPVMILLTSVVLLTPPAAKGLFSADQVTFDLLNELPRSSPSYLGNQLLRRHFPVGESGPIIVLAEKADAGFDSSDRRQAALAKAAIFDLTEALTGIEGVRAVRSLAEPLGDPPLRFSLGSPQGRQKQILQQHRLVEAIFLAQSPEHRGRVTRFELVPEHDPFSKDAIQTLLRVDQLLQEISAAPQGFWAGTSFVYSGTTAGIRDLRDVTRSDRWRIQVLVVLAVFLVLLFILRRPGLSIYLILSVLFSYLVTMGITEWFFAWVYADTYQGLDWKVPIFLFVILVAVGEDYNIYLVTRVLEEQATHGPFAGLRRAIAYTGGIITSCGVIMAGSFIAMTAGTLRGVVELGFALALGISLDTFVVRPIIVPAFLALLCRWRYRGLVGWGRGSTGHGSRSRELDEVVACRVHPVDHDSQTSRRSF